MFLLLVLESPGFRLLCELPRRPKSRANGYSCFSSDDFVHVRDRQYIPYTDLSDRHLFSPNLPGSRRPPSELLQRGFSVILVDARQVLAGETGRTTGHLSTAVDSGYADLRKTFGDTQAKHVYDAHLFAVNHIEEVSQVLGIDCEFKRAKYLQMVHVNSDDPAYEKENDLPEEYDAAKALGIPVVLHKNMKLGAVYHGAVLEYPEETHARFHPTLYLNGLLKHMKEKYPHTFKCFTDTRVESFTPPSTGGLLSSLTGSSSKESKRVKADIEGGGSILAKHLIETTNIPARTLPIVAKESYDRTYAIGIKAPLGAFPDILLYNNDDPYIYVRKTSHPDKNYELVIVGGEDHAVGFHAEGMYNNLVEWTKKHYPEIGTDVEFKWSGQIICPNDGIAYIGESGGKEPNCYLVTGDYGNGLTYGVAASKILTDIIEAKETGKDPKEVNPWVEVFDPSRKPKANTVVEMIKDNVIHQSKYLRWLTADGGVGDIEDIEPGCGESRAPMPSLVYSSSASVRFTVNADTFSPLPPVCRRRLSRSSLFSFQTNRSLQIPRWDRL